MWPEDMPEDDAARGAADEQPGTEPAPPGERPGAVEEPDGTGGPPEGEPEAEAPTDWEAQARHFQDLYLRSLAELENARRRFQKEKEENARYASESVIKDLVPFLDNLNLALSYADLDDPGVRNMAEGVRMTLKGCLDMLADRGLGEVLVERGQAFDPNVHEAIGQEAAPELPDNAVTRQVSKGYTLHRRLLRPAKVMVAKNPAP